MSILADPLTLAVLIVAVILLGMAKGGLAGVGAIATPLAALVLPPATAAALLLPILIVQDVISVWSFRKTWDGWVIGWMLPGAAVGVAAGYYYADRVDEAGVDALPRDRRADGQAGAGREPHAPGRLADGARPHRFVLLEQARIDQALHDGSHGRPGDARGAREVGP